MSLIIWVGGPAQGLRPDPAPEQIQVRYNQPRYLSSTASLMDALFMSDEEYETHIYLRRKWHFVDQAGAPAHVQVLVHSSIRTESQIEAAFGRTLIDLFARGYVKILEDPR